MKKQKVRPLPVSQNDLAAYLGISATLFSMARTGRHGMRQLSPSLSKKWAELVMSHTQSKKTKLPGISLKKMLDGSGNDWGRLVKEMLQEASLADARVTFLTDRLKEMAAKEQEDMYWLRTLDQLLAGLPKNKESVRDKMWLENQQTVVLERLKKYDQLAQAKLEIQIETEKARCRVYKDMHKKLVKN